MSDELQPGPAMDRAVAELMDAKPDEWAVEHPEGLVSHTFRTIRNAQLHLDCIRAEDKAYARKCSVVPVYPDYSTSAAWEQVADWLEAQGWGWQNLQRQPQRYENLLWEFHAQHDTDGRVLTACGPTRAVAVCRAVLALPEADRC